MSTDTDNDPLNSIDPLGLRRQSDSQYWWSTPLDDVDPGDLAKYQFAEELYCSELAIAGLYTHETTFAPAVRACMASNWDDFQVNGRLGVIGREDAITQIAASLPAGRYGAGGFQGEVGAPVPYGATDLSAAARAHRVTEGIWGRVNVAVIEYEDAAGFRHQHAARSWGPNEPNRPGKALHAERQVWSELEDRGVRPEQVRRVYSELAPCQDSQRCARWLTRGKFPNLEEITYSYSYNPTRPIRDANMDRMMMAVNQLRREMRI
jgi:hypothetical protein